ncbi:MAG: hypothetical protein Q7U98_06300 [Methylicorpusculum sp.]|uniref:hypothetical protein n=1 Tax=Methylicorpusculum sp. TaxID=2713644 RepID=UPI002728C4F5|nr:hypothetical protein [Methylicorpusculum sp.]MDO8938750.1 hypothetical protein [Methylicorpusculum sp.]MDP2201222.1 hypothetical protein [Methylicorpusculum sp.]
MLAIDFFNQGEPGLTIDQRNQGALIIFTDYGINFPIVRRRPLCDADTPDNLSPFVFRAIFLAALLVGYWRKGLFFKKSPEIIISMT